MRKDKLSVQATWDAESRTWHAESEDIPGLAAEAETLEVLLREVVLAAPELLELNGCPERIGLPIRMTATRDEPVPLAS